MNTQDNIARTFGGVAGAALALVAPHVACLGALTAGAIGAGLDAQGAQTIAAAGGAVAVVAAGGAAVYGARNPSTCHTHARCARRGVAMALAGFVLASGFNTYAGRGLPDSARTASYLEWVRDQGGSVWTALNDICFGTGPR